MDKIIKVKMTKYRIDGGCVLRETDSINEAITCAKSLVYLPFRAVDAMKLQLEYTGEAQWAYEFRQVTVRQVTEPALGELVC